VSRRGAGGDPAAGSRGADRWTAVEGDRVVVRVPYGALGLAAGATVRLCFHDQTMELLSRERVSPDGILTLR